MFSGSTYGCILSHKWQRATPCTIPFLSPRTVYFSIFPPFKVVLLDNVNILHFVLRYYLHDVHAWLYAVDVGGFFTTFNIFGIFEIPQFIDSRSSIWNNLHEKKAIYIVCLCFFLEQKRGTRLLLSNDIYYYYTWKVCREMNFKNSQTLQSS